MESQFNYIKRKTGKKQTNCKCELCKSQCRIGCCGTPDDITALINKGYANRLNAIVQNDVVVVKPIVNKETGFCTFYKNGLCELHNLGLKPTEGKLSHHSSTLQNFNYKKSLSLNISKLWGKFNSDEFIKKIHI